MCEIITINSFLLQNYIYNPAREYVPLPHVFPPFAIRKTLRVGTHSALAH